MVDNTTARMAGALAAVTNGATPRAAAAAHAVTVDAVYKAMRRHGMREGERCPTCNRLMPKRAAP